MTFGGLHQEHITRSQGWGESNRLGYIPYSYYMIYIELLPQASYCVIWPLADNAQQQQQ
jgi:hypothetical protein